MAKILVVEDDRALAGMVTESLKHQHFEVETAFDGEAGLDCVTLNKYDAIVLDWDLPRVSGIEILKELRAKGSTTPVLMLTGKGEIAEKETGFGSGADDYLTKPFHIKELLLRVQALVKRGSGALDTILKVGNLTLDPNAYRVTKDGKDVILVRREFSLLEFLMRNSGQLFSAETILERVWQSENNATTEAVRVCITRLRKKIDTAGVDSYIQNLAGLGYKFEAPPSAKN